MSEENIEGEAGSFSMADIAGFDIGTVEEFRLTNLPQGLYTFEVKKAGLAERTDDDGDVEAVRPTFSLEVLECKAIIGKAGDGVTKESLIGKTHSESTRIPNPHIDMEGAQKGLGRTRALLADMGGQSDGPLGGDGVTEGCIDAAVGLVFDAKIVHSRNANDPSRPYTNLRFGK